MPLVNSSSSAGKRKLLERMQLIREFELAVEDRYSAGELPGFVHLYVGEEAVATGACLALEDGDQVLSTHRGHGHCLAMGMEPEKMFAELLGKSTGYSHGKGGSMHMAAPDTGVLGTNGIVGSSIPLTTGAALTASRTSDETVVLGFVGDGGTAQGQVHEAINLAATWDLPAIFVIENNRYAETAPVTIQHNVEDLAEMATSYGIPGETVDGMDVLSVYDSIRDASDRARRGDGPTLIEAKTYRFEGHYAGDPETYRSDREVERFRGDDPIGLLRDRLIETGELTQSEFTRLCKNVSDRIEDAVEFAKESPEPDRAEAFTSMYAEPVPEIRELEEMMAADAISMERY